MIEQTESEVLSTSLRLLIILSTRLSTSQKYLVKERVEFLSRVEKSTSSSYAEDDPRERRGMLVVDVSLFFKTLSVFPFLVSSLLCRFGLSHLCPDVVVLLFSAIL